MKASRKRLTAEDEVLVKENADLIKDNDKFEIDNEVVQKTIMELIQRIDVSTLLKEIDVEEMRHQAT